MTFGSLPLTKRASADRAAVPGAVARRTVTR
jgi:hypothetical protein